MHPQLHMMFYLSGKDFEPELVLQIENTPGLSWLDLLPTHPKQEQISHNGDAKGLFKPIAITSNLILSQPYVRFEISIDELSIPLRRPL